YTPSGRLIQTPYNSGDREDYYRLKRELRDQMAMLSVQEILDQVPDSLKYTTDAGRTVIGGGGILPDFIVERDTASVFLRTVFAKNLDNIFVRSWIDRDGEALRAQWDDRSEAFIRDFDIDDEAFEAFLAFAGEQGVRIVDEEPPEGDKDVFTRAEIENDRAYLESQIKARLAVRLFDLKARFPIMHKVDRTFNTAMGLWNEAEKLEQLSARE
ncbi:MAG: S41 family peptidase, partial [Rhodothermales bacterium]